MVTYSRTMSLDNWESLLENIPSVRERRAPMNWLHMDVEHMIKRLKAEIMEIPPDDQ